MFRFKCASCSEWHEGMPGFGAAAPLHYYTIPEAERLTRCELTEDTCMVDGKHFFIRGCIEIPVRSVDEPFVWGVWVSLSQRNFEQFVGLLDQKDRSQHGPYFGWLSANFTVYPDAENLKTKVHLGNDGIRPYIELEPTHHPLAIDKEKGSASIASPRFMRPICIE
jgi:hypothetical protein